MRQPVVSTTISTRHAFLLFFLFLLLALILFLPVIDKGFVSDDFAVLYRVACQRKFFTSGFFRPLSDFSLYGSYLAGGFNARYYNIVNISLHAAVTFLLYLFCKTDAIPLPGNRRFFAGTAALLFLIYPFHNEAIAWAIGRGIVLSAFFGMLSLLVVFMPMAPVKKYSLSCIFYFISLCGYETTLPLPFIILLLLYSKDKSLKKRTPLALAYVTTLLVNMVLRWLVAGTLLGSYGSKTVTASLTETGIKLFKAAGRLFLPPSASSLLLTGCFVLLLAGMLIYCIYIFKVKKQPPGMYLQLTGVVFIASLLPALFGISTRTYEGDRVFYFTSFFLCLWISFVLSGIKSKTSRLLVTGCLGAYGLFFFYQSLQAWRTGGRLAGNIITEVSRMQHPGASIYLLNLPEEYEGAQVFRNGFKEALLINRIDTTGIVVVNYLTTEYALKISGLLKPVRQQKDVLIYPFAAVGNDTITARVRADIHQNDTVRLAYRAADKIYYWNKESFILLSGSR